MCYKPCIFKTQLGFSCYIINVKAVENNQILIAELKKLLLGGTAHASLEEAISGLPLDQIGIKPHQLPYSIWQLVEHIRIAQWDMLEFTRNPAHQSPKWPDEYWPKELEPNSKEDWDKCLAQISADRNSFIELLNGKDLFQPIKHGNGQTVLREALQIADHNAYHTAEIIVIRRLLGNWKS